MESITTPGGAHNLGTDLKDQVDKTQSTGFERSGPGQNEGKSSNEEEPDNLQLQITSLADAQAVLFSDDEYNSDEEVFTAGDDMEVEETVPEPITQSPQASNHEEAETHSEPETPGDDQAPLTEKAFTNFIKKMTNVLYRGVTDEVFDMHTEQAVHYHLLKDAVEEYNDDVREQNSTVSHSLTQMASRINLFLESLKELTTGVKSVQESVKDDPELNRKLLQASETHQVNTVALTELLGLIKGSNVQNLSSTVESLKSSFTKLEESVTTQSQKSTSLAWTMGTRMTALESSQAALDSKVSIIHQDTAEIKSMMTKMFQVFKGTSTSSSVTPTLAITAALANVERENAPETPITDEQEAGQPSHTEGEHVTEATPITEVPPQEEPASSTLIQDRGKMIATTSEPETVLEPASTIVRRDPDEPIRSRMKSMEKYINSPTIKYKPIWKDLKLWQR